MKNLKKNMLLVLAVVMTSASVVLASPAKGDKADEPEAKVSVKKIDAQNKKALIRITNLSSEGSAILRIKDVKGYVLHKEVIRQNDVYAKRYDLSNLPNGEYTVELTTQEGVTQESLSLNAGKAEVAYFKPAIQVEPGLVKIAFKNSIEAPVSLKFYDNNGQLLYQERVASQEKYAKGLNVSRLSAGQYSLSILGDNYVYSKSIEVK